MSTFLVFTDMCQHVKNIELFGVPNPSREERRKLCHRPSGSSNQNHTLDFDSSEDDSVSICNTMLIIIIISFLIIYVWNCTACCVIVIVMLLSLLFDLSIRFVNL